MKLIIMDISALTGVHVPRQSNPRRVRRIRERRVEKLPLEILGHKDFLGNLLSFSCRYALTIYDSIFLPLAASKNAKLLPAEQERQEAFE